MTQEILAAIPTTHPRTGAIFQGRDEVALSKYLTALEDYRKHIEFCVGRTKSALPAATQEAINSLLEAAITNGGNPLQILKEIFAAAHPGPAHVDPAKWADVLLYPPELEDVAALWGECQRLRKAAATVLKMEAPDVLYIDKSGRVHITQAAHDETLISGLHTKWVRPELVAAFQAAREYLLAAARFEVATGLRIVNVTPERRPRFIVGRGGLGDVLDIDEEILAINIRAGYLP